MKSKEEYPKIYENFKHRIRTICSEKFAEQIDMEVYFDNWVYNCKANDLDLMEMKSKAFYNWIDLYKQWFECGCGVNLKHIK